MADPFRDACLKIIESRGTLDNRFAEIKRLGSHGGNGAFSLLFSALDHRTNHRVALKFFRPDKVGDSYRWQCFQREAEILQDLAGQDDIVGWVAPLSKFDEMMTSGQGIPFPLTFAFFALELADSDMETALAGAKWTPEQLLLAFRCMCRAVQRIHMRSIAHRDLKPGNFLLTGRGVWLSDFGTARFFDGRRQPLLQTYNLPPGDWLYAAPEVLAGLHDVDPRFAFTADIFSLGAILFELFSGTKLGHHLAGQQFHSTLTQWFASVKVANRRREYEAAVGGVAASFPLPRLAAQGPSVPACIRDRIDELYRQLSAFDYNTRLTDFQTIFGRLETCLLILRNEEKYTKWRERKERNRQAQEAKRMRLDLVIQNRTGKKVQS